MFYKFSKVSFVQEKDNDDANDNFNTYSHNCYVTTYNFSISNVIEKNYTLAIYQEFITI